MERINIAVFGGSGRCIAYAARELKSDVSIRVFFDNDKSKAGQLVKKGYQYVDGSKVYVPYDNIPIDTPEHFRNYKFDYAVILAGSRYEIRDQLLGFGIAPEKIIVYDRIISSGMVHVPDMREAFSLDMLLSQAEKNGISSGRYKKEAKNLRNVCQKLFKNSYRLHVLEIFLTALAAGLEQKTFEYRGVKLDYRLFTKNPGLFLYESSDIFMDVIDEEMERIEYIEGPYHFGAVTVGEDDIVFDIGANYGLFSAVAAGKAKRGCVYAFEPVEETRRILERTAGLYSNIVVEPYAVSDSCGKNRINVSNYNSNPGAASIMNVNSGSETEEIETITLDRFVEMNHISKIDFIKADIEGAERLLLAGAAEVLRKFAPKLAVCTYHYPEDPALLSFMIKQANPNYVIEKAYGKLYAYVNK